MTQEEEHWGRELGGKRGRGKKGSPLSRKNCIRNSRGGGFIRRGSRSGDVLRLSLLPGGKKASRMRGGRRGGNALGGEEKKFIGRGRRGHPIRALIEVQDASSVA